MKKYLITGFCGFVSGYFLDYLSGLNEEFQVLGLDRNDFLISDKYTNIDIFYKKVDLFDSVELKNVLLDFNPDYILHLASISSVAYSWDNPADSFINNTNIFLKLIEIIRQESLNCRVLSIGSSEEYGVVSSKQIPIKETEVLNPISPYAIARVSQEMLSKIYADKFNVDIVMTRSFNHIGPKQLNSFVLPSFIEKMTKAKAKNEKFIEVGNIDIIRDFLDVRDVVNAYFSLLLKGRKGEVYNVCSGKGISLREVLDIVANKINYYPEYRISSDLIRPADNPIIIGDNSKITNEIGWKISIEIEQSIEDIIDNLSKR